MYSTRRQTLVKTAEPQLPLHVCTHIAYLAPLYFTQYYNNIPSDFAAALFVYQILHKMFSDIQFLKLRSIQKTLRYRLRIFISKYKYILSYYIISCKLVNASSVILLTFYNLTTIAILTYLLTSSTTRIRLTNKMFSILENKKILTVLNQ